MGMRTHAGKRSRQRDILMRPVGLCVMGCTLLLLGGLAPPVYATCPPVHRSQAVIREFRRTHVCPATGRISKTCPGFVVDHIDPLCKTGPSGDRIDNLQYQTIHDSYIKDREERAGCHRLWYK